MAFKFYRQGTKAVCEFVVDGGWCEEKKRIQSFTVIFAADRGTPVNAALLVDRLNNSIHKKISAARENAYLRGYKHGRSKKGREGWFQGWLEGAC